MRFFFLPVVLMLFIYQPINGQNKLTLSEAVQMSFENNIDLKKQYAEVKKSELLVDASGRLPNPVFSYSREDLKDNTIKYNEWSAAGSLPINFIWDRWSAIESKEKALDAQKYFYEHNKHSLEARVSTVYSSYSIYSGVQHYLNSAYLKINELAEISKHRVSVGDVSEYEVQRILIELAKIKSVISELAVSNRSAENEFKLLTGYKIESPLITEKPELTSELEITKDELIKLALQNRNDLLAASLLLESESAVLSNSTLKAIPVVNLTAGYKKQDVNMSGTVLQLEFEIPLFNRNQYDIEHSEIQIALIENEKLALAEKIKTEVSEAYDRYEANRKLFLEQSQFDYQNLFNAVTYSYELGEISLVELIDGINAYIEGVMFSSTLEVNLYKSYYELEQYTASSLMKENK